MRHLNTILVIIMFTTLILVLKMAYGYFGFPYPYYMLPLLNISGNTNAPAQGENQGYTDLSRGLNGSLPGTIPSPFEGIFPDPSMGAHLYGSPLGLMGSGLGGFMMPGNGYPWPTWPSGYGMFGMYGSGYGSGMSSIIEPVTVTTQTFHKFCFPGGWCFYAIVSSGEEGE